MLTEITNPTEAKRSFRLLEKTLNCGEEFPGITLTTKEGKSICDIWWHSSQNIWSYLSKEDGYTWCCYGIRRPENNDDIVVEINPLLTDLPLDDLRNQPGGMFAKDEKNIVCLCHTGRIGGGTKGIGKSELFKFLEQRGETNLAQVDIGRPNLQKVINLGPINETLIDRIENFVRTVKTFKDKVKQR